MIPEVKYCASGHLPGDGGDGEPQITPVCSREDWRIGLGGTRGPYKTLRAYKPAILPDSPSIRLSGGIQEWPYRRVGEAWNIGIP